MKINFAIAFLAAAIVLAGCSKDVPSNIPAPPPSKNSASQTPDKTLSDDVMQQKLIGVWKPDPNDDSSADLESVTVRADGTVTVKLKKAPDQPLNQGTWKVSQGSFLVTIKDEDGSVDISTNKVIRLDDHVWTFQEDGDTDVNTLHKQ